jgi:hypothetical protein
MTAITLNLLAEEQQAQAARAHDPLKIVIAIGLGVLTVAVACGSTLSAIRSQKLVELHGLEARWNKMNNTGAGEGEFQKIHALAEEIVTLNHSRLLMAPQLAMVKEIIPTTVQLSQLSFSVVVETPDKNAGGEEAAGRKRPRPRQIERLVLRMQGTASSSRPELEVDHFLQTLRNDARFGAVVDDIQLRSISRGSIDPGKTGRALLAASFVIECRDKEKGKQ